MTLKRSLLLPALLALPQSTMGGQAAIDVGTRARIDACEMLNERRPTRVRTYVGEVKYADLLQYVLLHHHAHGHRFRGALQARELVPPGSARNCSFCMV